MGSVRSHLQTGGVGTAAYAVRQGPPLRDNSMTTMELSLSRTRDMPGISPEVRKWGRYLIFDWIGLGKGDGCVQAYLAHDHWRDDKKMVVHSWESHWIKLRHSPLATRCIMYGS